MNQRILGIDPGFGRTGYGLIEVSRRGNATFKALQWGVIETSAELSFRDRLNDLFTRLSDIISESKAGLVAMEKFFYAKNLNTGIKVAEARGVIQLSVARSGLDLVELSPREVKNGVCGHGGAGKGEVQRMVTILLALKEIPRPDDAADALAVALSASALWPGQKSGL